MSERRPIVVGVLVMSLSLLALPFVAPLVTGTLDSGVFPDPSWNWLSWPIVSALQPVMPILFVAWYVGLFVLVAASTAELVFGKWGVFKDDSDDRI